jgi:glycosyltransferase involved in cell wall biosynthesis
MLELRWNYRGSIHVCRNALRPSLRSERPPRKSWPRQRPIRLGLVGRMAPEKGMALALHALKLLRGNSMDSELHIAGAGGERERLRELAARLGISSQVRFHGVVGDMQAFYGNIDCLLHPALREPFGLVAIEAASQGCPVIAAAVDGLPEAVRHGVSGYCIPPRLPVSDYPDLGGSVSDLPDVIYDPARDDLSAPRLVDPRMLADAVSELFSAPEKFEGLSRAASA